MAIQGYDLDGDVHGHAESTQQTAATRPALAQRRILHPAEAAASQSCWSYDFVEAQTHDERKLRLMTLIDEFTMPGDPGGSSH